jgi:lipopolysaccharide transport system permease protein
VSVGSEQQARAVVGRSAEDLAALPGSSAARRERLPYRYEPPWETLRETWRERHLLWHFSVFAVRRSFYLTLLGPVWLFIHVGFDIGGKAFLFGGVLNVQTPGNIPYIVFLLTGMLGWTLFQQTMTFGVKSIQRYRRYAERFSFPLLILPIAAGAQALVQFCLYLGIVVVVLGYYAARGAVYYETGFRLLLVPAGLLLCLLFSWGLSCFLAPLNYRKRDVRLVLKYVLQFWLYLTPVVYPLQNLHGFILLLAKLNPLAPMVEMIKYGLIGGGNTGVRFIAWGTGCALCAFVGGLTFLNWYGPRALARPLMDEGDDDDDLDEAT